ncbi:hypothetical protein [Microbulbifer sp. GL-2]|uniref:hypothetical protein n=1 Tax=Microbulbifer sp. GL-2 TaxID=2591606 RepID=UPI001162F37E|nr:hypothetical protein [Microbulbifer sp. GL-2]BBM04183.1 hypothetical protein GL2_42570 [Microbulbifer sp. GL-2]
MTNAKRKTVNLPNSLVAVVEQRRIQFVKELSDLRLALKMFGGDAPQESRVAYLNLIDRELMRIQEGVNDDLRQLPDWLTSQV